MKKEKQKISTKFEMSLPPHILVDCVLPFVANDRLTWNAMRLLNREINFEIQRLVPPWPEVSQKVFEKDNNGSAKKLRCVMIEIVDAVAFHPDESTLVCCCSGLDSDSNRVHLWNRKTGRQDLHSVVANNTASMIRAKDDNDIREQSSRHRHSSHHASGIRCIAISSNGEWLASGSHDMSIKLWKFQTEKINISDKLMLRMTDTLFGHRTSVTTLQFSPDSTILASGSFGRAVKLWDLSNMCCIRSLNFHQDAIRSLSFSVNGNHLAVASDSKFTSQVVVWTIGDFSSCLELEESRVDCKEKVCVAFSPCGHYFVHTALSGRDDNCIIIRDAVSFEIRSKLCGHTEVVSALAFSSNAKLLASSSDDETIRIWDMANFQCQKIVKHLHYDRVTSLAWVGDSTLASSSWDGTFRLRKIDP